MAAATKATTTKARGFLPLPRGGTFSALVGKLPLSSGAAKGCPQASQRGASAAAGRTSASFFMAAPHFEQNWDDSSIVPSSFSDIDIKQVLTTTGQNDSKTTASSKSA